MPQNPSSAVHQPSSIQDWFETRTDARAAFLARIGWGGAALSPVGEDCAFRRYFRLRWGEGEGERTAILMESVPDGSAIATPGHNMLDFVRIGAYLRALGLQAPEVYEADELQGYILLEDFGDTSFKQALAQGVDRVVLYGLATDVLSALRRLAGPDDIDLPRYYKSHVHTGRRRVVDWYMPAARGRKNPDGLAEEYLAVWDSIERKLPPAPVGFLHIDYHFENLMWMPTQKNLARCGILDFQGAMSGPIPYDLANLLEDARVDVSADLRTAMLDRYCADMPASERAIFLSWYRVLASQFHCRVIGQFIRLAVRDGKTRYLPHIPRVAGYLRAGLEDPLLAPLKKWFAGQGVDFSATGGFDPARVKAFIREDAF